MDPKETISDEQAIKKAYQALATEARILFAQDQSLFVMEILCGEDIIDEFSAIEPQKVVSWQVKNYPNAEWNDAGWGGKKTFLPNISERRRRNIYKMYQNMLHTRQRRAEARERGLKRKAELEQQRKALEKGSNKPVDQLWQLYFGEQEWNPNSGLYLPKKSNDSKTT